MSPEKYVPWSKRRVRIQPRAEHTPEGVRNAQGLLNKQEYTRDRSMTTRIAKERARNKPRGYTTHRRVLGLGTSMIHPDDEVIVPYRTRASRLLLRLYGAERGESVELVSHQAQPVNKDVDDAEKRFIHGVSPATEDFVIDQSVVIRFRLRNTRTLML